MGLAPTESRVPVRSTGTEVRVQEVGRGPAVVFLHGATNAGTSWATLVAPMDGYRCLLVDRPGCGLSDPLPATPDVEGVRALAESLVADLLDGLGLSSAHVVATSFGGLTALRTAAAHPERVQRMVLFGWTVGAPIARPPMAMRLGSAPGLGRLMAMIPPTERTVRALLSQIGLKHALETGGFSDEALAWFTSLLRDTGTLRNELRGARYLATLRGLVGGMILTDEELGAIRTPVSFLWGEEDPFGGEDVARRVVARIPNAELEMMADAGHAVWMDDAVHAARHVMDFLGR